jgi:hypothetical protein
MEEKVEAVAAMKDELEGASQRMVGTLGMLTERLQVGARLTYSQGDHRGECVPNLSYIEYHGPVKSQHDSSMVLNHLRVNPHVHTHRSRVC